jgi:hypothetical protein
MVSDLSNRLQVFEKRLAEGRRVRRRVKWMRVGDSDTMEFYQAHK